MAKIVITPVSKPRQTQSDRWKQRPAVIRYRAFADDLRAKFDEDLPYSVYLHFEMPMSPSWSKRKKEAMLGTPHMQKPDIDNLIKAVMDALLGDDSVVWRVCADKVWDIEGSITIETYETDG